MRNFKYLFLGFALVGLATQLSGCAGKEVDENDPASMFADAEADIKSDHYQIAVEKFRTIRNKFPYSKYSVDAQLRMADVYFMQESWAEAAANYETFNDLHPKHEKVPYAMFRVGKSYFNDTPDPVARDLTSAQKALEAYNGFIARFANAPEAEEAKKDIATIRRLLAEKELYVGDYYFKRELPESARPRYMKVIELFPETDAARLAKEKVAKMGPAKK